MDLYYHNIPQLHQSKYQQENDGKCLLIIKYQSRNMVPTRQQAVYLGTLLSDTIYLMLQKSKPALLWQSKLVHAFKKLGGMT